MDTGRGESVQELISVALWFMLAFTMDSEWAMEEITAVTSGVLVKGMLMGSSMHPEVILGLVVGKTREGFDACWVGFGA